MSNLSGQMIQTFRSLLFVPGTRADRFEKAAASGADAVIIDLEDAVLPGEKDEARAATLAWIAASGASQPAVIGVRINSPRTAAGCADIAALARGASTPAFVMVPKAETAADMEIVGEALGTRALMGVIESGRAISNVFEIARQARAGLLFGGADYSASLGAELTDWDAMLMARATIASACGAGMIPGYDVPYLDVSDPAGLEAGARRAKALGLSGRACIHPAQVAIVNAVFSPTRQELEDARALIAAASASGAGAVLHNGKLVDRPVVLAAERLIERARG